MTHYEIVAICCIIIITSTIGVLVIINKYIEQEKQILLQLIALKGRAINEFNLKNK